MHRSVGMVYTLKDACLKRKGSMRRGVIESLTLKWSGLTDCRLGVDVVEMKCDVRIT